MIAQRWVLRAKQDPVTAKVRNLVRPAPRVDADTTLSKAAKLMIQSGVRQLPVFEKDTLRGMITDESIILQRGYARVG